ncbi:MAG: multicomponent Na+:H+ antiporter subunit [Solirubrobacteraceae bacterium]|nr:multicomponent Na+:H+ antiporter subunit [Solirubrobacteraceae bacterium]
MALGYPKSRARRNPFAPGLTRRRPGNLAPMVARVIALGVWCFAVWVLLTWMFTPLQLAVGTGAALAVAIALAPLGPVPRPWLVADPRRLLACAHLGVAVLLQMIKANLRLARRIWSPRRPLASGMVIATTEAESDGALTAVGLLSSLVVDNQLVDLDRPRRLLQYHAVAVPPGGPDEIREAINGPIERLLAPVIRPPDPA